MDRRRTKRGIIRFRKRLPVFVFFGHDDVSYQSAGDAHLLRRCRSRQNSLHLRDHDPTVIVSGLSDRQNVANDGFLVHDEIAKLIRRRRANQSHMNRERMIQQPGFSPQRHSFDQFFSRLRIQPAAAVGRINECAEPHMSHASGSTGSNVAKQMTDDALRKIVGFDFTGQSQLPQLRTQAPVPTNDASQ